MRAPSLTASLALLAAGCASPVPGDPSPGPAPPVSEPVAASAPVAASVSAPVAVSAPDAGAVSVPARGRRVYAKTRFVWVHYEPSAASGWLGFLWLGGHADVKGDGPVQGGPGCTAWYAVEPRGYVCADGSGATTDPDDPALAAMRPFAPDLTSPWPHHYGESRGAERYRELPTEKEQRSREWELPEHRAYLAALAEGKPRHPSLEGVDLSEGSAEALILPTLPSTLREQRRRMNPLSTVAWSRDVVSGDRSFLLTADLLFVPKDRVAPYPRSDFAGVVLGEGGESLPLAFFRARARPKYRLEGEAMRADGEWPRLAHAGLTGTSRDLGGVRYLETREAGVYVAESDATVVKSRDATPWGAPVGAVDASGKGPGGRQTWLEASILGGYLIAYEGTRPVYASLISPGRGGLPEKGKDEVATAATPLGLFPITGKFATATMVAPGEFVHSDVPWTQNFHGPHALHSAYWHDAWGEKKSAGCINVSPIDGKWLYEWTEPRLPAGWHGVRYEPGLGSATWILVHP